MAEYNLWQQKYTRRKNAQHRLDKLHNKRVIQRQYGLHKLGEHTHTTRRVTDLTKSYLVARQHKTNCEMVVSYFVLSESYVIKITIEMYESKHLCVTY